MEISSIKPKLPYDHKPKKVAAYARVSAAVPHSKDSLELQVDYYRDYITHHPGWELVDIYADEAVSGTKNDRPEFNRMMEDSRAGKIDLIITKSISRFARNTVTLLSTVRELKELGVRLYCDREHIYADSGIGEVMLTALGLHAEEEARAISEYKTWQIQKDFAKGIPTAHYIYGYKYVGRKMVIVPEEAKVVKRIFDLYVSGMGVQKIAETLNNDNIPAARGGKWGFNRILFILHNEKYAGHLLLQKTYVVDFITKKQKLNKGERDQKFVYNDHEAVVSDEVFLKVQEELKRRREEYERKDPVEPLYLGIIFCGDCGRRYVRLPKGKQNDYRWYCPKRYSSSNKLCRGPDINERIINAKTREVLGLPENYDLTRKYIAEHIDHIVSNTDYTLTYYLKNGEVITKKWEPLINVRRDKLRSYSKLIICHDHDCNRYFTYRIYSKKKDVFYWSCDSRYRNNQDEHSKTRCINERILDAKTREVLGLSEDTEITRELVTENIDHIDSFPDRTLEYHLKDGRIVAVKWEPSKPRRRKKNCEK